MGMRYLILSCQRFRSERGAAPPGRTQFQPGLHPDGGIPSAGERSTSRGSAGDTDAATLDATGSDRPGSPG